MLEFTTGEQAQDRWGEALRLAAERRVRRLCEETQPRGAGKGDVRFEGGWARAIMRALCAFAEGVRRRRLDLITTRTQIQAAGKRL